MESAHIQLMYSQEYLKVLFWGPYYFTSLPLSEATKVSIYADDLLVYKPIETYSCFQELQEDINLIQHWSVENLMSFNTAKCKCMLLHNQFCPTMMLNGQPLENVEQYNERNILLFQDC